jgi:hypothetical protein
MWQRVLPFCLVALMGASTAPAGWQEIAWPYARDAWPAGRAFRCASASCGGDMVVSIRPKIGFCNCATGVSGDDEVDAVTDLDLVTEDFVPAAIGERVTIRGMKGIARRYVLRLAGGRSAAGAGFALATQCDLVVAAVQGAGSREAVAGLLEGADVMSWLNGVLGR